MSRLPDIDDGEPDVDELQEEESVHPVWPVAHLSNVPEGSDGGGIGGGEHEVDALPLQLGRAEDFLAEPVCRPQQALVLPE